MTQSKSNRQSARQIFWRLIGVGVLASILVLSLWQFAPTPMLAAPPAVSSIDRPNPGNPISVSNAITYYVYLPLAQRAAVPPSNPTRQQALDFYLQQYLTSEGVAINWTGNHATCNPGTTSQAFRDAVLRRINYFRAVAGVPNTVTLNSTYNAKAQAAALMMSVNQQLNHTPPSNWLCYTADGAQAAGSSNLYLGVYGPSAITGYMRDPGGGNYFVGHRRWIIYPQTQEMGTGDIPPTGYPASNDLWVFDSNMWGPRPSTRDGFVAWPPPGYVPYQVVFARWSFSYPNADFSAATVSMTSGGSGVSLAVSPVVNGYGENTLVWIPMGLGDGAAWPKPAVDTTYRVNVQNAIIGGVGQNFAYDVIIFDPTP